MFETYKEFESFLEDGLNIKETDLIHEIKPNSAVSFIHRIFIQDRIRKIDIQLECEYEADKFAEELGFTERCYSSSENDVELIINEITNSYKFWMLKTNINNYKYICPHDLSI